MKIDIAKLENFKHFQAKLTNDSQSTAINEVDKTISFIALSANNLHKRYTFFGDEYFLSVDTSGVSFNAKTLYLDHDPTFTNAIGKIEAVKFENGDFKVIVKFDDEVSQSREAFARFKAGFSDSVSVGFGATELKEMPSINGVQHFQITKGEIVELSAVWQGADPNAKVAKFAKEQTNKQELAEQSKQEKAEQTADISQTEQNAHHLQDEFNQSNKLSDEVSEILALAAATNNEKAGIKAVQDGLSLSEFRAILSEQNKNQEIIKEFNIMQQPTSTEQKFSLSNIILAGANLHGVDLGYELENHYNKSTGRFMLPFNFGATFSDKITTTTQGAGAIATDFREDLLIEDVKKESPLLTSCNWLSGLSARTEIPRNNSSVTAEFVEEGKSRASENLAFDKIILDPHTLLSTIRVTRTMLNMSSFGLEKIAYEAMKYSIRRKLEETILYGKGVIKGIFEISGVLTIQDYLTAPTLENTLKFGDMLDDNGGDAANAKFALKNSDISKLRATFRHQTSEKALIEDGTLQGYPYFATQLIEAGDVAFGNFKDIFVGSFGNLELITHQERGGDIVVELYLDVDAKLAREKSFVISKTSV